MISKLLSTAEMPSLEGLSAPRRFYQVLAEPAPLAGMVYPRQDAPWAALHAAGFRHVVNLAEDQPAYDPAPLWVLFAGALEDLAHGGLPFDPVREAALLRNALRVALPRLEAGEGLLAHCYGGTGRTGTFIGCLLRRLGYPANQVIAYLDQLNRERGKAGWPESPWQAQFVREFI